MPSYITSAEKYGYVPLPIFMLARGNVLVGDDPAKVTFEREGIYTDQNGDDRYVISFTRTHDLSLNRMVDSIKGIKRIAARLVRFDGAYLRFVGDLQISRYHAHELVETYKSDAIWELMYF